MALPLSQSGGFSLRPAVALAALIAAGVAGNYFHLPLFFGVDFLFGGIAVLLVLVLFGATWGVLAALLAASYTVVLWHHPYALIVFSCEALAVGWALWRGYRNIIVSDGLFWLLAGMPLSGLLHYGLLQIDAAGTLLIMLKQGVNGFFNALIASLLLDYLPLRQWAGLDAVEYDDIPIRRTIFNLLLAAVIFPAMTILMLNNRYETGRIEHDIKLKLDENAGDIAGQLLAWEQRHLYALNRLAERANASGTAPTVFSQRYLELMEETSADINSVHIGNAAGITLASSFLAHDAGGQALAGLDFSGRAWFKEMQRTLRPVVSDVFIGKIINAPAVSISVPLLAGDAHGGHRLRGFVVASLNPDFIGNLLNQYSRNGTLRVTVLDRQRRVVASTQPEFKVMQPFRLRADAVNGYHGGTVYQRHKADESVPINKWKGASYALQMPVGMERAWTLVVEAPLAPYLADLQNANIKAFTAILALIAAAFLAGAAISRFLSRPLAGLAEATSDVKFRCMDERAITLPRSRSREINFLICNFREMVAALQKSYHELNDSHRLLEKGVELRTRELLEANLALENEIVRREQYEKMQAQQAQQLKQIADELESQKFALDQHSIVSIADVHGNIIYVNDKFSEISQYSREELLGKNHRILRSGYHSRAFFEEMWVTIAQGKVWRDEIKNRKKDGSFYWVDSTIVPFLDAAGLPYQYVSIRTDITQRKQHDEELIRALDAAQVASRAKSEFLSRMSHELRTPLNAILGFAQLLESDPDEPLTPSQEENTVHILKAGWHLLELINEVLDLSRIEMGGMQLFMEEVELDALVRECIELVAPLADRRRVKLVDRITPCVKHWVQADRMRLKQVLINLMSNAIKYNREQGMVTLECQSGSGGMLRVSVSDEGMGIAADKLEQLFQPFNRLDADKSEIEGAGMGLAITKRLVELMRGAVGVSSEPGKGSCFWIELEEEQK